MNPPTNSAWVSKCWGIKDARGINTHEGWYPSLSNSHGEIDSPSWEHMWTVMDCFFITKNDLCVCSTQTSETWNIVTCCHPVLSTHLVPVSSWDFVQVDETLLSWKPSHSLPKADFMPLSASWAQKSFCSPFSPAPSAGLIFILWSPDLQP